jgi:hypothetical protein
MDLLVALDNAHALTRRRVAQIKPEAWGLSTPCGEWDVGQVALHFVPVMETYDALSNDTFTPETWAHVDVPGSGVEVGGIHH